MHIWLWIFVTAGLSQSAGYLTKLKSSLESRLNHFTHANEIKKDVFLVLSQAKDKERIRFVMKITIFLVSFTMSSSNVTIFPIVFTYCLYKNARHSSHMNLNDSDLAYHDAVDRRIHKSEGRLL